MKKTSFKSGIQLSSRSIMIWRIVQTAVWLIGAIIVFCLLFYPDTGINLFWNMLIPSAPLLLVVFTGVWRNVCPMATNALLPRHFGLSKRKRLSTRQTAILNLVATVSLLVIVPLRHTFFNTNGPATAILILTMAALSFACGFIFEWKSAWCSGLCPVHPVEKLYGLKTMVSIPNAHCTQCRNCVIPCPDSTPDVNPLTTSKTVYQNIAGHLMIGGFPGFVWGWFHVPDHSTLTGLQLIAAMYNFPLLAAAATLVLFILLKKIVGKINQAILISIFAAAAVACYYWFRIPSLIGFGMYHTDGMLINLRGVLPEWMVDGMVAASTLFFFWWIVFRKTNQQSWVIRPQYALHKEDDKRNSAVTATKLNHTPGK
ncbi:hypothetical protein [Ferruginibacter sp.]|uniref:hypothetical protein n=1 Tax=Ferruginibacter sp. TaxID=1940288 RepID=UPI002658015A|nr:hypothetical protein [Ferruginibacter sp.]